MSIDDEPIQERVRKLEEQLSQLLEILQIVPRMDTRPEDFGSAPNHAKTVFLSKLAEIAEDPTIAPQNPFHPEQ